VPADVKFSINVNDQENDSRFRNIRMVDGRMTILDLRDEEYPRGAM
jgi:hypothetical protein